MSSNKTTYLSFATGDAGSKRARNEAMTWPEFIELMDEKPKVRITGRETEDEYAAAKMQLKCIFAAVDGRVRNNDTVAERSILFIDLDKVSNRQLNYAIDQLEDQNITYYAHTTTGDRHDLKGGPKSRSVRFLIPTNKPMPADDIWQLQWAFYDMLGIVDLPGIDGTACQRARIMFAPHKNSESWTFTGRPVRLSTLYARDFEAPQESGSTNWTDEALANADENSRAIADWAFEMGLEPMSSGRGWAVTCPNEFSHSNGAGVEGSTAILLPDATHPEVRFVCMHEHCRKHNSHQHMMLGLVGVPDQYLPEAHNISKKQIAELLPDISDEEVSHIHERETMAAMEGTDAGQCTDADLDDEATLLFGKSDPLIEGLINFRSTWYLAGESNIGKSFYVLGQMAAIAAGKKFAGARVVKSHCFYLDAEGGETSHHRKQALQKMYNDPLDRLHIIDLQQHAIDITDTKQLRELARKMLALAGDEPVGLIAADSLNQAVAQRSDAKKPFDENSPTDMGEVVRSLKYLADMTGGAPGVIHHPAKGSTGRTARGSGALHGAVDNAYFIEQPDPEKPLELNLYHEKSRNGVKQTPRGFLLMKCKIDIPHKQSELVERYLVADELNVQYPGKPKPLETAPRDETLWLIPVAFEPFNTQTQSAARQAVKEAADNAIDFKGKAERTMYAQLEQLQADAPDPRGYSPYKIGTHNGEKHTSANCAKALRDMLNRGLLVNGLDETGQPIATNYRIPDGINDFDNAGLVACDEDLE